MSLFAAKTHLANSKIKCPSAQWNVKISQAPKTTNRRDHCLMIASSGHTLSWNHLPCSRDSHFWPKMLKHLIKHLVTATHLSGEKTEES